VKRPVGYLDSLRALPALRDSSPHRLAEIAKLVDIIDLPAGSQVHTNDRELVVTAGSVRALVVARRAMARVHDLAPELVSACADAPPCDHAARDRAHPRRVQRRRRH
jgi:hypothetical protein